MTLKEKINADFVTAFKNKETAKKNTLGMLKSKITENEKKAGTVATDADVMSAVQTLVKQRQQTVDVYKEAILNGNRNAQLLESMTSEEDEIAILQAYLPQQLTAEEVRTIVVNTLMHHVNVQKGRELGEVMKYFKANYNGQYDSKTLKDITESILKEQ